MMPQYTKLPEAVVQATPFPTCRLAIKPDEWAVALKDVGQLREVDRSKLVVTP
jgi:hypothetical protein